MSATLAPAVRTRGGVPHGCPLTIAEFEMVRGLADGKDQAQIACDSGRALSTVRTLLSTAYRRLGVSGGAQAVAHCCGHGWIGRGEPAINHLALSVGRLARAITSEEKSTLTAGERSYLHAFEDYLYARTDEDKYAARMRMDATARRSGITPHPERGRLELMDVLVSIVKSGWVR
jgi:DNA-binding CsgD family transcriptional regulator